MQSTCSLRALQDTHITQETVISYMKISAEIKPLYVCISLRALVMHVQRPKHRYKKKSSFFFIPMERVQFEIQTFICCDPEGDTQ